MPKPIFDVNEYELRGVTPPVFSEAQKKRLNTVLSRVNGQIDWTAQLLGFNGPNYWGRPNPKADGSYNWKGLPDTMNQKRQLQATTFGVYDKDKDYSLRPAPFNRSEIKASGDASFHIWESGGKTYLSPLGQGKMITYGVPNVFVGGEYIFNEKVEFIVTGTEDSVLRWSFFNGGNVEWTRMLLKQHSGLIQVKLLDSDAEPAYLEPIEWQDISDWKSTPVLNQYIGLWGNKGNSFSFDAAFDALELHGFSETKALSFRDSETCLTPKELLAKVGLQTTTWTKYWNTKFGIQVGNSPIVYPLPAEEVDDNFVYYSSEDCNSIVELKQTQTAVIDPENELFDNGEYGTTFVKPAVCLLSNGFYDALAPICTLYDNDEYNGEVGPAECELDDGLFSDIDPIPVPVEDITEGIYDRVYERCLPCPHPTPSPGPEPAICGVKDEGEYDRLLENAVPCSGNDSTVKGIKDLCISYIPKTECAYVDFPCVEFVFDPSLDDGEYPKDDYCPANPGPWATADDGEFDSIQGCYDNAIQSDLKCEDGTFCGFNDGVYDKRIEPNCDDPVIEACKSINGGFDNIKGPPNYLEDCDCYVECCLADGSEYVYGDIPYLGPNVDDGGVYDTEEGCTTYNNREYDRNPDDKLCTLDNGFLEGEPAFDKADEGSYDRILEDCQPCLPSGRAEVIPCPVPPVRVNLVEIFSDLLYVMQPEIENALTPLRVWKNRVLTVTDEVPAAGTERYNFLVADENKGVETVDDYRYFVRLPIEYPRNGPDWAKAEAVCNNQGYFSAPPQLSETENAPPVLRPVLFDEEYFNVDLPAFTTFYAESYLVSTSRIAEQDAVQEGFEDSSVSFEAAENVPFEYGSVLDYDAFEARIPYADGEWRGNYYHFGTNEQLLSSFIVNDLEDQRLQLIPKFEEPIYDMSRLKVPNIELPNKVDQAAMKNYVVSYAYFVTDYSASDDPVFDPGNEICWRSETLACEKFDDNDVCVNSPLPSRTAYLLHPTA